jgi:hypothetical protein
MYLKVMQEASLADTYVKEGAFGFSTIPSVS